jgi:hypothetical protein
LDAALDGRSLDALSPGEVFTLVKALPAVGRQQAETLYRGVMADMLRNGRLERASALLELQDLRQSLSLDEADHHAAVRLLAAEQPQLLENDRLQRQRDELRLEAASEAVADFLRQYQLDVLTPDQVPASVSRRLEQLAETSGLDADQWQQLLQTFGPRGDLERQRVTALRERWIAEVQLQGSFAELAQRDPLLRPLHQVLINRNEALRQELVARLDAAGLDPLPERVDSASTPAVMDQVLQLLWSDPDPDTAGWVLMLARERAPELATRMLQNAREGLGDSSFLQQQRLGVVQPLSLMAIAGSDLFADLMPAGVLWVAAHGRLQDLPPGAVLMHQGDSSDSLALVVSGTVQLTTPTGQHVELGPGQSVGEMGVIRSQSRNSTVCAGVHGAQLFTLPAPVFEDLLRRSPRFSRGLLVQLAERLARA